MKSRELLKAIGEIDDSFILEAEELGAAQVSRVQIRTRRRRIMSAAACVAVVVLAGIYGFTSGFGGLSRSAREDDRSYSVNSAAPTVSPSDRAESAEPAHNTSEVPPVQAPDSAMPPQTAASNDGDSAVKAPGRKNMTI